MRLWKLVEMNVHHSVFKVYNIKMPPCELFSFNESLFCNKDALTNRWPGVLLLLPHSFSRHANILFLNTLQA